MGILDFSDPELADYPSANRRDAALAQALAERGVPSQQVHTLYDTQATRSAVLRALEAAADATPAGGTLLFYYAGHGIRTASGDIAYVAHDTLANDPSHPGVSLADLLRALTPRVLGKRLVFLGDCCHSGGLGQLARQLETAGAVALSLTSADASNQSTGNWTYTQVLLEGLRGDATLDADTDGVVALSELEAGVRRAMNFREGQLSGAYFGRVPGSLAIADRVGPARRGEAAGTFMRAGSGAVVRVNRVEGGEASVRVYHYASYEDFPAPMERLTPITRTRYAVGASLNVEWGGRVWPAVVTETRGDFARITYPGWPSYWDEWIVSDRVRR